ncbi:MAG TPA: WD40 repeat domain-containing protein, partial [Acidimicrobiia bacterium]|nr:WD40 repeat domain-containing protein [Acidimicrobiia bacterium]
LATHRPDLGILLALQAWRHAHTTQAEQALLDAATQTLPAAQHFRAPDTTGNWVLELAAIPEHGYVLGGRRDGSLVTWALPTGGWSGQAPAAPKSPHSYGISAVTRDASGQRIVTVDARGGVAVWDAATLHLLRHFSVPGADPPHTVLDASLSADGQVLMVATDTNVTFWDVARGQVLATAPALSSPIAHAAMSPDASHVAVAVDVGTNTNLVIWNTRDWTEVTSTAIVPGNYVDMKFSNDGQYVGAVTTLATTVSFRVSDAALVTFYSPQAGTTVLTGGVFGGIAPVGDNDFIAVNGSSTALRWSSTNRTSLSTYPFVLSGVPSALTVSGNGAIVVADNTGAMSYVPLAVATSDSLSSPEGQLPAGSRFATSASSTRLLAVANDRFTVWDVNTRHGRSFTVSLPAGRVLYSAALDATGRRLAIGYADGSVDLRDARSGDITSTEPAVAGGAALVSFAGDNLVVASVGGSETLRLVSPSGAVHSLWRVPADRRITAFATGGDSVGVGLDDGSLLVWPSYRRPRPERLDLGRIAPWHIAFAPSGNRLVVGDGTGRLQVVDHDAGGLVRVHDPISTDHGPVFQLGFSDPDRVVAVSPVLVSYADLASGNMLAGNVAPTSWLSLVTVPHGFVTVDVNGALRRWRLDPKFLLSQLCPELKEKVSASDRRAYLDGDHDTTCPAAS